MRVVLPLHLISCFWSFSICYYTHTVVYPVSNLTIAIIIRSSCYICLLLLLLLILLHFIFFMNKGPCTYKTVRISFRVVYINLCFSSRYTHTRSHTQFKTWNLSLYTRTTKTGIGESRKGKKFFAITNNMFREKCSSLFFSPLVFINDKWKFLF